MWALVSGSSGGGGGGVRDWRNFQSSSTRSRNNQRSGWAEQGIATQLVSQIAERSVRQLAAEYAARGALEERTNEMTAAAVAHPVGMEVVTARCRNGAEWRRQKEINKRAKEVIRARQEKADEDATRAAHNGEVVRRSAAGAAEEKRKRRAEKNKRHRKNKQVKRIQGVERRVEGEGRGRLGGAEQHYGGRSSVGGCAVEDQTGNDGNACGEEAAVGARDEYVDGGTIWREQSAARQELVGVEAEMQCTRYKRSW